MAGPVTESPRFRRASMTAGARAGMRERRATAARTDILLKMGCCLLSVWG